MVDWRTHWEKKAHNAETQKTCTHLRDRIVIDLVWSVSLRRNSEK